MPQKDHANTPTPSEPSKGTKDTEFKGTPRKQDEAVTEPGKSQTGPDKQTGQQDKSNTGTQQR